jgi:predicted nucleic acid-binding protein
MSVLVDTSALITLLDGEDPEHGACRQAWQQGVVEAEGLITTDYIVLESVAVAQRRWGLDAVRVLVDEFLPLLDVEGVTPEDRTAGVTALLAAGRRRLSLVDCVSFVVMRRRGIRAYMGLDPHFDEQGFTRYAPAS